MTVGQQAVYIEVVALLADRVRRSLYEFVTSRDHDDVTRDEAAEALGIRRGVVAFHLDKLADAGLLTIHFRRPPGVGGPGAGRPTKHYRRSGLEVSVNLPERHYELMGGFLAAAVGKHAGPSLPKARAAAHAFGRNLASGALTAGGRRRSGRAVLEAAIRVLAAHGFEPALRGRHGIVLRNCPFSALAANHRDTVCQINLALHDGVATSLSAGRLVTSFDPTPGRCCVTYHVGGANSI